MTDRIERYLLVDQMEAIGPVEIWRGKDPTRHDEVVTLEVLFRARASDADLATFRSRAEVMESDSETEVRLFEDTGRGILGVAKRWRISRDEAEIEQISVPLRPERNRAWALIAVAAAGIVVAAGLIAWWFPRRARPGRTEKGASVLASLSPALPARAAAPVGSAKVAYAGIPVCATATGARPSLEGPTWFVDDVAVENARDLRCDTKVIGGWFRARCKQAKKAPLEVEWPDGDRPFETIVTPDADESHLLLLIPLLGVDQRIHFVWKNGFGSRTLILHGCTTPWAQGSFDSTAPPLACRNDDDCKGKHCCVTDKGSECSLQACGDDRLQTCKTDGECAWVRRPVTRTPNAPRPAGPAKCKDSESDPRLRVCL